MNEGVIMAENTPQTMFDNPKNERTRNFLALG